MKKECNHCHKKLNLQKFCKHHKSPDGLNYTCRSCAKKATDAWRKTHPRRVQRYSKRYAQAHRSQVRWNKKLYRLRHPEKAKSQVRNSHTKFGQKYKLHRYYSLLKERYGLTKSAVHTVLRSQHNKCAICKGKQKCGKRTRLYVDHCHNQNIFRGFLCFYCNALLGFAKDNVLILAAAIQYLEKHI